MKVNTVYTLKWANQYFLNRWLSVILTVIFSIIFIGYFNTVMGGEITSPLQTLDKIENSKYTYVGITNHSNYEGSDFYQQVNIGSFYTISDDNGYSGRIDAVALKKLPSKEYKNDVSLIEQYKYVLGYVPTKNNEVVISQNTAKRYGINLGDAIFYYEIDGREESYYVCGIVEDFYGLYDIDTTVNSGLILLHEGSDIDSSRFVHFVEGSNDNTYSEIHFKRDETANIKEIIKNSLFNNFILSVLFSVVMFLVFNLKIRKAIARLKQEKCKNVHIIIYIVSLVAVILAIIYGLVLLYANFIACLGSFMNMVILTEYMITLIFLTVIYSCIFLKKRKRK